MIERTINLDRTDLKILRVLQETGKISNLNLSKKIGLSPAPTLERVKKLEQSGVLKSYHAHLDSSKLGLSLNAIIQFSLVRQVDNAGINFISKIKKIPEVMEVYQVTGDHDFIVSVLTKDIAGFERIIREEFTSIEEIGSMKTMIVLKKIVDRTILPLNYDEE